MTSLTSIKAQQQAREEADAIRLKRRKGAVVLMLQYCQENGYMKSLESLQQESGLSLGKVCAADNIDIVGVIAEFEEYHDIKFGRRPRLYRSQDDERGGGVVSGGGVLEKKRPQRASSGIDRKDSGLSKASGERNPAQNPFPVPHSADAATKPINGPPRGSKTDPSPSDGDGKGKKSDGPSLNDAVSGKGIGARRHADAAGNNPTPTSGTPVTPVAPYDDGFRGRALKPLPLMPTNELSELAGIIQRDILESDPSVSWDDITQLHDVKRLLKEAVVMPSKYPELFQGPLLRPWKGILMFGPPGNGKTMLAKAVATECRTTFFNISASTIVSKWRGDSEKLVRLLFEIAAHYAPSTIFLDELDSVMSARSSDGSEHEGSRRLKTELLIQMDGLAKKQNGPLVFVLAASNIPWDLDPAMLRRLEKRIHVGAPTPVARAEMFRKHLTTTCKDLDADRLAAMTDGYSGSDIEVVCREATMKSVRSIIDELERLPEVDPLHPQSTAKDARSRVANAAKPVVAAGVQVRMDDIIAAVRCTKSTSNIIKPEKYVEWEKEYGSTISV